jgi:cation diffusion facilitator family transporter
MLDTVESNYKLKILKLSTIAIFTVVLVEAILGVVVGSLAILSDGLHALLDTLSALGLFILTRASLKPADEEHMYGHEKLEPLGGLIAGLVLISLALFLMHEAIPRIIQNQSYINPELESAGFMAIGYTLCIDFLRIGIFRKALGSESSTVKAGFYHAIADLGSTVIALLGFGLAAYGLNSGDSIASTILSTLLVYLSIRLVWTSGMELSDSISRDVAEKIRKEITSTKGVHRCENLKVRKAGDKTFVEATVQVPEYMKLEDAHDLTSRIETKLKQAIGKTEVTIHTEPVKAEMPTEELVGKIAGEIEGVKEAHRIAAVYTSGKLYITLHARVDPKLSVQEAHNLAGKIENKIKARISEVENVTVHIEPFSGKVKKGPEIDENEIRRIVRMTLQDFPQAWRCTRVVTYFADKTHYVNIDCSFSSQIPIEDAHKIASLIERNIKRQFRETIVTVHIEPD